MNLHDLIHGSPGPVPIDKTRRLLPARTRIRLWLNDRVNRTGIWLADHGHYEAARRLWRI